MKILSYHPFSLYGNGGGSHILRRLYSGKEENITSLVVQENSSNNSKKGIIEEISVNAHPQQRKWMRFILRDLNAYLRHNTFKTLTNKRVFSAAKKICYDILHVVDHGPFSDALCEEVLLNNKKLWVSFHDHYSVTYSSYNNTKQLWDRAERRFVISKELGEHYQNTFGNLNYEIVTDGINNNEISTKSMNLESQLVIYFAGLLHISYLPLFRNLADALEILKEEGFSIKLELRGTQEIDFLKNRRFEVEFKPFTLDTEALNKESDEASILYLPLMFSKENFYRYSLSTKLVGYLGKSGCILYHGPKESAANNLLEKHNAATVCYSLSTIELAEAIKLSLIVGNEKSKNAKHLAESHFNFKKIKSNFWNNND
jgi:hypothetical protein